MTYIGPEPNPGQNREVDDISSGFNGNATAFTLQVNSQNVSPGSSNAIIVSLGGVVQNPGTDYTVAASTLTFTTAPASGLAFFGLVLGQQVDTADANFNDPVITGDLSIADKIVHTGDTNNAIRFPAADTITAETNGSERVRVDSSGKVGIGTTSPINTLHINGDGTLRISPSAGANQFESGRTRFTENTSDFQGAYIHYDGSSNIFHIGTHAANDSVAGNDLNAISIPRGSANVGIGVTDPDQTLEVAGVVAGNDLMVGRIANRFPIIQRHTISQGSESLTITAGAGLTPNSSSAPTLNDALNGAAIQIGGGNPTSDVFGGGINYYANGHTSPNNPGTGNQHVFYTRSGANTFSERFRIKADGDIVRTVVNNMTFRMDQTAVANNKFHNFMYSRSAASRGDVSMIAIGEGNSSEGRINIRTSPGNGGISGGVFISNGGTSFGSMSDIRLKTKVSDIVNALTDIVKIDTWKYKWNNDKDGTVHLGITAQSVNEVYPECVEQTNSMNDDSDDKTEYFAVLHQELIPVCIAAIKELKTKVETLETEVAALKAA